MLNLDASTYQKSKAVVSSYGKVSQKIPMLPVIWFSGIFFVIPMAIDGIGWGGKIGLAFLLLAASWPLTSIAYKVYGSRPASSGRVAHVEHKLKMAESWAKDASSSCVDRIYASYMKALMPSHIHFTNIDCDIIEDIVSNFAIHVRNGDCKEWQHYFSSKEYRVGLSDFMEYSEQLRSGHQV